MSADFLVRLKELERRTVELEQKVLLLIDSAQDSSKVVEPVGQNPPKRRGRPPKVNHHEQA